MQQEGHTNKPSGPGSPTTAPAKRIIRKKTAKGDANALNRVTKSLKEGNFYEAQQLIKMLYNRYISQSKWEQAEAILVGGMKEMLAHGQYHCASELGNLLIKMYNDIHKTLQPATVDKIIELFNSYPQGVDAGRANFMKAAIKWTIGEGNNPHGDPRLHDILARYYNDVHDYARAQQHFLRGTDIQLFGKMLLAFAQEGYPDEADLFITRTILQYLCLSKLQEARVVTEAYLQSQPHLLASPSTPLINFDRMLLYALEKKSHSLFNLLRATYAPSLKRDPEFSQYLDQIALVYFNERPQAGGLGGFFNDFLKSLLAPETTTSADGDEESEEAAQ